MESRRGFFILAFHEAMCTFHYFQINSTVLFMLYRDTSNQSYQHRCKRNSYSRTFISVAILYFLSLNKSWFERVSPCFLAHHKELQIIDSEYIKKKKKGIFEARFINTKFVFPD